MALDNGRVSLSQVVRDELRQHEERWREWRDEHREKHGKDDDHVRSRHSSLEKRIVEVEKLVPAIRAILWVGAGLGVSIIGLIWSLITGQVQLVFSP